MPKWVIRASFFQAPTIGEIDFLPRSLLLNRVLGIMNPTGRKKLALVHGFPAPHSTLT